MADQLIAKQSFSLLATASGTANVTFVDVLGNKTDAASNTASQASAIALLRFLEAAIGTPGGADLAADVTAILTDTGTTLPATLGTPADTDIATDIANVDAVADAILVDTGTTLPATLGTPTDTDIATDIVNVQTDTTAILEDTGTTLPATLGSPAGASISADIAVIDGNVDSILVDTGTTIPGVLGTPAGADLATDIAAIKAVVDLGATAVANGSNNSSGTYSYLDAGGEQDIAELTNTTRKIVNGIWLDAVNLTNNGTFKVYYKVDGTNYREVNDLAKTITAGTTEAVFINANIGITEDIKVTYEEASDEGAARNIEYSVIYETKE